MPVWIFEDKEMDVRPIRTKRDYHAALKEAEALWDSRPGSKESDRLEVLTLLIQAYESEHYPIPDPDPIEPIKSTIRIPSVDGRGPGDRVE